MDGQNARTLARFGGSGSRPTATRSPRSSTGPTTSPTSPGAARPALQFLEDAAHPRGLWRRTTLAASLPNGRIGKSCSTSTPWPRPRARTGSGAAPRPAAGTTTARSCACRAAAAMPSCCASSIWRAKAFVTGGFVLPEAKGAAELAGCRYAAALQRLWRRGDGDALRLCAHRPAVASRRGPARRAGRVRDRRRAYRRGRGLDRTVGSERVWFYDRFDFFDKHVWIGDRSGRKAKLELPTDAWVDFYRGHRAGESTRTPWTVGGVTYAADTLLAGEIADILAGEPDLRRAVRAGRARGAAGASPGRRPPVAVDLRQSPAALRGVRRGLRPAGRARVSKDCRRSAWSRSGGSIARRPNPTAIFSSAARIR